MAYAADLHLHSAFSYACSKNLTLESLASWAKVKGIDLLASADFTHPRWREELGRRLAPSAPGIFEFNGVQFVLGTEVSCVYRQGGKGRKVHILLLAPDFDTVDRINLALADGKNKLESDGRPTLRMSARDLTALALDASPECIVIPAHVWTPWFGVFGSKSGFDHLEECFLDMTPQIHALETGLSSDPAMMWPLDGLADRTIVSFSDAHSAPKLGREMTVFQGAPSYRGLADNLARQGVDYTVEFYPEEGKYHYSGHRKCGVRHAPGDTQREGCRCPVCGRPLTLGVLHRVRYLSNKASKASKAPTTQESVTEEQYEIRSTDGYVRHSGGRPPFIRLVPLVEIISESVGQGPSTRRVEAEYRRLIEEFGNELRVLLEVPAADLERLSGETIAQAVAKARAGDVRIDPGYDGVYGKISVSPAEGPHQGSLF